MIDRDNIATPQIKLTKRAAMELKLILENDFYVSGKHIRISIDGKECDGFTYSLGFSGKDKDDIIVQVEEYGYQFTIVMDPFCAYYLSRGEIEYFQDFDRNLTGFLVNNIEQDKYSGKFWRKDPNKEPPTLEKS